MKTAKVEADADAEAIFWEVRIDDSSDDNLSMQHYVRVKIFTERGREKYSKFDITFSKGMKIKDIAARVIKPDGSIVEIAKQDIFEREIVKANRMKVKAKSFAIPSLEPGVIVEYRYREVISDAGASGMRLKFQRDIPVQKLAYYYKPYNKKKPNYQNFNFTDAKFIESEKGFWVATRADVPALKEEPHMPPDDQIVPWILLQTVIPSFEASGFTLTISVKDPGNPVLYWGAVGRDKSFMAKFMNKPDKEVKKVATEVVGAAQTDDEKLRKLYEFCQEQIHNTSYDTSLTDDLRKKLPKNESVADVLKRKKASSQFVDLLFGAMASSLGYDARIAFSSDRSEIFFKPEMTNESFIHPAAIAVKVGQQWRFFNPGLKFLPYGMLVWYEEDVWALLVGDGEFAWTQIPLTAPEKSLERRTAKLKLLEDGTLEGDVKIEYTGHSALTYRLANYEESDNNRQENLKADIKRRLPTADVSDLSIDNVMDGSKPLVHSFKVRVPQYAQKTGKRLFLQPSFFEYGEPSLFSSATRKYEVYFHYPWSQDDQIEIELPAGYSLDSAERPAPFGAQKVTQYKVSMGVTKDQKTLVVRREFFFGGGGAIVFPAASYTQVKSLFDLLHKSDEHTITLKQAAASN
ncbi:MAG TPA: DUF3857 domain-containing protein [Pyrinomonadaceae bacterium]|nr:DUF3857 domain-containing protein [Pyrinomonadaceae bacterium]